MSDPKRYTAAGEGVVRTDPKGPLIEFNPFDPVSAAVGAMHGQNLLAAKDARIKQLEQQVESYRAAVMVGVTENTRLKAELDRLTNPDA